MQLTRSQQRCLHGPLEKPMDFMRILHVVSKISGWGKHVYLKLPNYIFLRFSHEEYVCTSQMYISMLRQWDFWANDWFSRCHIVSVDHQAKTWTSIQKVLEAVRRPQAKGFSWGQSRIFYLDLRSWAVLLQASKVTWSTLKLPYSEPRWTNDTPPGLLNQLLPRTTFN